MQIDRLIEAIDRTGNPSVIGLDTQLGHLPEAFSAKFRTDATHTMESAAEAIFAYNCALVDALSDIVPAVKVQVAYYEMYGVAGMRTFQRTLQYAREKELVVIADAKRNDIGATAEAYATAFLGKTRLDEGMERAFPADFVTVTPYLGEDGVLPFLQAIDSSGNGIFVLVKTSNPSSGQLQDLLVDGKPIWQRIGALVGQWGEGRVGSHGYSAVGAVVGATYPNQGTILREQLPQTFFLVPGYGAQGATARDLAGCFDARGRGAIVNASRSILMAWQKQNTEDFQAAARNEAQRMRDDIRAAVDK